MKKINLTTELGKLFQLISQFEEISLTAPNQEELTPSELHIVECIGNQEKMTSKEIGEELRITKGAVSQQLKKLIKSQVVEKEVSLTDKRVSFIKLTEKGELFYQKHQEIKLYFEQNLAKELNEEEMIGFIKGISLLNNNLEEMVTHNEKQNTNCWWSWCCR